MKKAHHFPVFMSTTLSLLGAALAATACGASEGTSGIDEFVMPNGADAKVSFKSSTALFTHTAPETPRSSALLGSKDDEKENEADENNDYDKSTRVESVEQQKACATALGVDVSKVQSIGNRKSLDLSVDSALFIKLKGNKTTANITIETDDANAVVPGLCVFSSGNKTNITINQSAKMKTLYFRAKGNKSLTKLNVAATAKLDSADLEATGNKATLAISGAGSFDCATITAAAKGNKSVMTCTN